MRLIITAAALVLAGPRQSEVEVRWKLAKDQTLRYRFLQKVDINGGLKMEFGNVVAMTVSAVDGQGVASVLAKYESVMFIATGNQECHYDSEKDKEIPDHPYARMVSTLVGKSFSFRLGSSGQVSEVKGSDSILPGALKAGGESEGGFGRQMIEHLVSDDFRKTQLQQMSTGLPEGKVTPGGTWTGESRLKIPVLGSFRFKPKCTLARMEKGETRIEEDILIEYRAEDNSDNPFAALSELKSHKASTSVDFLVDRGRVRSVRNKVELVLAVTDKELSLNLEYQLDPAEKK